MVCLSEHLSYEDELIKEARRLLPFHKRPNWHLRCGGGRHQDLPCLILRLEERR